jgi:hypothetical protein
MILKWLHRVKSGSDLVIGVHRPELLGKPARSVPARGGAVAAASMIGRSRREDYPPQVGRAFTIAQLAPQLPATYTARRHEFAQGYVVPHRSERQHPDVLETVDCGIEPG